MEIQTGQPLSFVTYSPVYKIFQHIKVLLRTVVLHLVVHRSVQLLVMVVLTIVLSVSESSSIPVDSGDRW